MTYNQSQKVENSSIDSTDKKPNIDLKYENLINLLKNMEKKVESITNHSDLIENPNEKSKYESLTFIKED